MIRRGTSNDTSLAMIRCRTTLIFHIVVAAAVLATLLFTLPLLSIASGSPANYQAPGDDRPTLEATRMPLTVLPVQTVRAGLTATTAPPSPTTTSPAATATITPTLTPTAAPTTPAPTVTALASTATPRISTPGVSAAPTTTTAPDAVASAQMHYVTHLPTRQLPQQHLPAAGDGRASLPALPTLLIVALLCCGSGWLLVALTV